jgi:hypothetical protein
VSSENSLHRRGKRCDMRLEGARKSIEPVSVAKGVFHGASRHYVFDPEGDNGSSGGDGAFDFPTYVGRVVRLRRKDQDKNATGLDRLDDLLTVLRPGGYVAWRHPAADTVAFKARHDSERCCPVCRGITQKYVVSHLT